MKIIKRNGAEESFDEKKIMTAVSKANLNGTKRTLTKAQITDIAEYIAYKCEKAGRSISVEEIQDMVESQIMAKGAFDVAQRYIKYRYTRAAERQGNTTDARVLSLIECNNEEVKQENSNKNPVINSVQRDYMAGEVSRDLTQRMLLPKDIVEADKLGIIHFHDADYYAQHMHNCFLGTTQFVTADGVKQFNDYNDGDKVEVVDKYGVWRTATVHTYEKQPMQVVTFATTVNGCKITKKVTCTADHRWILHDGTVTTALRIGMKLQPTAIVKNDVDIVMTDTAGAKAWCLGYIIGRNDEVNTRQMSVDSEADKAIFEKAGYTVVDGKVFYGNVPVYGAGLAEKQFLAEQAWRMYTKDLKASLFAGLLAGKNAKAGRSTQLCMTVVNPSVAEMVETLAPLYGCYITKTLRVFDRDYRKDNAYYFMQSQTQDNCWTVTQIKPYKNGRLQQTWCVEEPVTHSFMLADGIVTGNCDLVNLEDMLQNGTVISETLIEKPHSFSTACNIATQIIAQVASSQYGGQSISLTHLAPFVQISREKIRREFTNELNLMGVEIPEDKFNAIVEQRLHKEIEKGVQTIQYQVVTLMTTNGQAPFLTVFMYLNEAKNENEKQDLALIIEEMLRQRYQGVKNEAGVWITPAFPKLIYVLEDDNVEEDSPYFYLTELAAKCTAKRLVPDYISEKVMLKLKVDKNGEGHCYTCMGCRSFLTPYVDENGKPKYYGRFNQGVVTINLVDVALSSGGDMDRFWKIFDERLDLCYRALMCRHERLKGTLSDAAPILWQYGALARLKKGEPIDKLLYGGYSTISLGYAGLCECTRYMTGKSHTDPEATPFALEVMQYMNTKCTEWKEKENIGFSIYGTPLESTTYKFAKCLQKRFGVVKGVTDKNYITNSYHIHVTEQVDAFTKLKFESQFQALSPGGAISYVEVPNMQNNIPAVIKILKCIYENIMYAELNTKSDYCQVCGYDGEIQIVTDDDGKLVWECPKCGNRDQNKLNVARRTCGYIGSNFWNQGRTQEIKERVLHL